ncbi:MAG: exodeoxyribonuclease VII large subunit [Chloroflexi bacterium]|nr:exodeoxyribonuclease VII large subunit [Chloroflexota bacterium]
MQVYSVGEIGAYLHDLIAADEILADVWVAGEITNLSRSAAGHYYFSLKDDVGQLRSVLWRGNALRCGASPQSGEAVVAHGRFDYYEPQGSCQLVVDLLYPAGVGEGYLRFEALRLKLEQEGLFAEERKRSLPAYPRRIGLVTSESGAVYHDVVTVLARRYPICQIVFCHSSVQGDRAPLELVAALQRLAEWRDDDGSSLDVVIVARGGGSPEELACFNDERLARAVFASPWPVISAVGHETDVTICDFVADVRAPTPSAAAEMVAPDVDVLRRAVRDLVVRGRGIVEQQVSDTTFVLQRGRDRLLAHSPLTRIARAQQARLDGTTRVRLAMLRYLETLRAQVDGRSRQLEALSPHATLGRGYSIVTGVSGVVVRSTADVTAGDALVIQVSDGALAAQATNVPTATPEEQRNGRSAPASA